MVDEDSVIKNVFKGVNGMDEVVLDQLKIDFDLTEISFKMVNVHYLYNCIEEELGPDG